VFAAVWISLAYSGLVAVYWISTNPVASNLFNSSNRTIAAAVNASPFQLIESTPAATSAGSSTGAGAASSSAVSATSAVIASAIRRSGVMRLRRTSDHHPAPIRAPMPRSWTTASTAAACAGVMPRLSWRKRTVKPTTHICGATINALPPASVQIRRSRNGGGGSSRAGASSAGRGPSRSTPAESAAPTRQAAPRTAKPQPTPPAWTTGGRTSAYARPLIGIAVWRIPSASPRS
jgi:hypothetical protein